MTSIPAVNHEGIPEAVTMWQYRRYLDAVRTFMELRAEMGESPSQALGARNGAWAHQLMDRLLENADDPKHCKRETKRLEESIRQMRQADLQP